MSLARVDRLFQRYDRFLATSQTSPAADRLHARWDAIIDAHRDVLDGRRVLDIASHDGRWSYAALDAGAAHDTGVEPREELVAAAGETFAFYEQPADRYAFVQGDIFQFLGTGDESYDVILCLSFYYHTVRHVELFDLMERTGARSIIIDTEVVPPKEMADPTDPRLVHNNPYDVQLLREPAENESMAAEESTSRAGHTIVCRPSRAAVEFIARHFGFDCIAFDWANHLATLPEAQAIPDYRDGWRSTFHCVRGG